MSKVINDTNEICNKCGKPTQSIFGTSRKRWCPDCEGDERDDTEETPKIDGPIDPWSFKMYDPPKKNKKK